MNAVTPLLRRRDERASVPEPWVRAMLEQSRDGVLLLRSTGRIEYANAACERMTGYSPLELVGRSALDLLLPNARADMRLGIAAVIRQVCEPRPVEVELLRADGGRCHAELIGSRMGSPDGMARLLVNAREVTDRAAGFDRRDEILQALSSAARRLLWNAEWESGLEDVVRGLGPAAGASRAWVMRRVERAGRECLDMLCEWCSPGIEPQLGKPDMEMIDVREAGLEPWLAKLATGEPLAYVVADLPASEQRTLVPQDILSLAMAPILVGSEFWGLVGFDDCRVARRWTAAELEALNAVAQLMAAAIHRSRGEAELRQAKEEAVAASVAKSDFLARMSHELRTPLTSVIGFANILRRRLAPDFAEEEAMLMQRIGANAVHLLALINDILDISKVEAGKVEVQVVEADVGGLVAETLEQFAGGRERVQLEVSLPAERLPLRTDPARFRQVLLNLVGNAFKFTEAGVVSVRLETAAEGRPVALHVSDTGIGIPADRLASIFDAFEQADVRISRRYGGTGLGLTISRALCRLMGHDLEVHSELGRGSTFTIRFEAPPA